MSKYTTEVRFICESEAGLDKSEGYATIDNVIRNAIPKIFDFDFPIFDESYRSVLETKILKHYYTREICEETVGLWKLRLNERLNLIMPYYNKLYSSELLSYSPLLTKSMKTKNNTEKNDETNTNENNTHKDLKSHDTNVSTQYGHNLSDEYGKTTTEEIVGSVQHVTDKNETNYEGFHTQNDHWDKYSETPQSSIDNVWDGSYLTNAREVIDDNVVNGKFGTIDNTTDTTDSTSKFTESGTDKHIESGVDNKKLTGTIGNDGEYKTETKTNLTSTTDYVEEITGFEGVSASSLIVEFRNSLLNIDELVIKKLSDLFFTLW